MTEELIVYTIPEVAEILKVERKKVERLIKSGALQAKLIGNSYRITHRTLVAFIHDVNRAQTTPITPAQRRQLRLLHSN